MNLIYISSLSNLNMLIKTEPDTAISSCLISTSPASMREEVVKVFKELREITDKFSTMLVALLAATNTTDTGKDTLLKSPHDKIMVFLVLVIVVYYLTLVVRTVLAQLPPQNTPHLPIISFVIVALLASSASVLALVIII